VSALAEEKVLELPVLPMRNAVLFPHLFRPFSAGRPQSTAAVEAAMAGPEKTLVVLTQKDTAKEVPVPEDFYSIGTRAVIKKMARSDGLMEFLVQGVERVTIVKFEQTEPFFRARVRPLPFPDDGGTEMEATHRAVIELARKVLELAQPEVPVTIEQLSAQASEPLQLVYLLGSILSLDVAREQALLEAPSRIEALRLMHGYLSHEIQVLHLRQRISSQVQTEMGKEQRDYMLRQQLRAIQEELGEKSADKADVELLRQRLQKAELPEAVKREAERELGRLERLPPVAPDYQLARTYIELILELPWQKSTPQIIDLPKARQVLDEDHYGLKEIKERILEQLAVLKLNPRANAPILCFVGPPGVGKTSLGQSIARALGRVFERLSLGGMHDEAELRGHRRTYIGAMPGRILQTIRRAGVNNPLIMLDEVDKLGQDFRGDPASALLEILDPAQNSTFRDNYLHMPFDLSKIFFITTANSLDPVPRPLLDRMEILPLTGYSEEEKLVIAERYLIPRQLTQAGLTAEQLQIPTEALRKIIGRYTREAGVRQLERAIGRVARKIALRFAEGRTDPVTVQGLDLPDLLGPERFRLEQLRKEMPAGVATGLAWTEAGGEVLYIEASLLPDGRGLTLTGHLGEVMRESAQAALSYVWAHADVLGLNPARFRKSGIHIHVPAGAVPKDGPSAGVAMATAIASLYTDRRTRSDTAMTGEITLGGLVLPIGGVREKVLAARRAGIHRVILPKDNEQDLRELAAEVKQEMQFVFCDRIEEVLSAAIPDLSIRLTKPTMAASASG
jgi:ATP-dependent Lon protease